MGDDPALHLPAIIRALGEAGQSDAISAAASLTLRDLGEVAVPYLERAAAEGEAAIQKGGKYARDDEAPSAAALSLAGACPSV